MTKHIKTFEMESGRRLKIAHKEGQSFVRVQVGDAGEINMTAAKIEACSRTRELKIFPSKHEPYCGSFYLKSNAEAVSAAQAAYRMLKENYK